MSVSTYLGKIPGPMIYEVLADKYEKKIMPQLDKYVYAIFLLELL